MTRKIDIFDTTLRDGEQSPGASMNAQEKLVITRQLLRLGVDVIEAGFPVSSPGDFESVQDIARLAGDSCVVCGLTRAVERDIDVCAEALQVAARPRIHTGIGVSPEHLKYKFKNTILFQYDALIDPELRAEAAKSDPALTEFGLWFEMSRPLNEAAGLPWRPKHDPSWDHPLSKEMAEG